MRTKISDDDGKAVLVTAGTNTVADNILRKLRDANAALPEEVRPLSAGEMLRVSTSQPFVCASCYVKVAVKRQGGAIQSALLPPVRERLSFIICTCIGFCAIINYCLCRKQAGGRYWQHISGFEILQRGEHQGEHQLKQHDCVQSFTAACCNFDHRRRHTLYAEITVISVQRGSARRVL